MFVALHILGRVAIQTHICIYLFIYLSTLFVAICEYWKINIAKNQFTKSFIAQTQTESDIKY